MSHPCRRPTCVRWAALAMVLARCASAADLPRGRILETVACAADASQTYALYVPASFDPARRWPVVICFDPAARGRVPVERFTAAAERFGYIVAGSNNSRNGPWETNATAVDAIIKDVDRLLPLDRKRIYLAGLSGGARVACQVAAGGLAAGVIACGAGFVGSETPSHVPFAFFGTAGVTDFNYLELRRIDRELQERRASHRVVFHPGGHEWLPPELAVEALAWLDLQAMRSGAKPKDASWIEAQFAARQAALPAGPLAETHRALTSLAADFTGLMEVAAIERQAAEIGASREWRDALKAERAAARREETLDSALLTAMREGAASRVRKVVAELRRMAEAKDTAEGRMATRVLQGAHGNFTEATREWLQRGEYTEAEPMLEMMALLRPDRPQTFFDLARCTAQRKDRPRTLAALQRARAAGFTEAAQLEAEPAFKFLRREPAYLELVNAMRSMN